ncbi:TPA: toxin VasX [Escherichia coli]
MANENIISAKPCTQEIGRIPLLPIRYGIIPKCLDDSQKFSWEGCEYNLEEGFTCVATLNCSKYTLRALRVGYVYTYLSSPKYTKLIIHEHQGNGLFQELQIQYLEQYNSRDAYASGKQMPNVWIETDATEVWIGYSSHLWTQTRVNDLLSNLASRQRFMQAVDVAELVNCNHDYSIQKNILPIDALEQWVEEYKPEEKKMDMRWSEEEPFVSNVNELKSLKSYFPNYQPKVPAVIALLDAEGIAIDVSAIAELYRHQINDIKSESEDYILPKAMRLDVSKLHIKSKRFYEEDIICQLIFNTLISLSASKGDTSLVDGDRDVCHFYELIDEARSASGARFAKRINQEKFLAFLEEKKIIQENAEIVLRQAELATIDHCAWLSSAEETCQNNRLSVASALMLYDRNVKISAYSLEMSIAMMINGVGNPIPGREDKDTRTALLNVWLNDTNSPVYKALLAYSPFGKDANSVGGWLGAADNVIQEISKKDVFMRATAGTDLLTTNIVAYLLKSKNIKGRPELKGSALAKINAAADGGDIRQLLGILRARYTITNDLFERNPVTSQFKILVESGMVELDKAKITYFSGRGKRDLIVVVEQDLQSARATEKLVSGKLSTSVSVTAASAGLLLFGMIYLFSAYVDLKKEITDDKISCGKVLNFIAALSGALAGCNALLVSVENFMKRNSIDKGVVWAGEYYKRWILKKIASAAFGKYLGIAAIGFSLFSDLSKWWVSDTDGKGLRFESAIAGAMGSLMVAFPSVTASFLPSAVTGALSAGAIPIVGWIVVVGLVLILVGIWLGLEADEDNHTSFERWVNHTIFGAFIRDENSTDEDMKQFQNINEAIVDYFKVRYKPILVDSTLASYLTHPDVYTQWKLVGDTISTCYIGPAPFVLYLPDFVPDVSDIREITSGFTIERMFPENGGVLLRFSKQVDKHHVEDVALSFRYRPNTGFMNDVSILCEYKLEFDFNQYMGVVNKSMPPSF